MCPYTAVEMWELNVTNVIPAVLKFHFGQVSEK